MVTYTSLNISMLYVDFIFMRDGVEHPFSVGSNNNISDRSEAKGTAILSDLSVRRRSRVTDKSAIWYNIYGLALLIIVFYFREICLASSYVFFLSFCFSKDRARKDFLYCSRFGLSILDGTKPRFFSE